MNYSITDLSNLIDHTNLHPDATAQDIQLLCQQANQYHFKMVAINQSQTALCAKLLNTSKVHVGAAISFPLGQTTLASKLFDTQDAIANGADEIDYVVNLTAVKNQQWSLVADEMQKIVFLCRQNNVISKVIFENCYLTTNEIIKLAEIAKEIKPDFIKTSTGFGPSGATIDDVKLMKKTVGNSVAVKAAGGIRNAYDFLAMLAAGATRIGTSAGIAIITELNQRLTAQNTTTISITPTKK